jgi:hypothetical protein
MKPRYVPIIIGLVKVLIATLIYIIFDNIVTKIICAALLLWSVISFKVGFKASDEELEKIVNDPNIDAEDSNRIFRKHVFDEDEEKNNEKINKCT